MGVSSNGHICYGIVFNEDYKFPWNCDKYEGDIDLWWIYEICSYTDPFELWDETGNYVGGIKPSEDKIDEWYKVRREFEKEHPVPVSLVNYCSGDYPMYILAIPDTYVSCSRGGPVKFSMDKKVYAHEAQGLVNFCEKYCQPQDEYYEFPEMTPEWYVSSYMD